jgi:ATP-binding cassette, subfamily F, member 3
MLLQVNGISKSYGTTAVLTNISMQIGERERVGLVGVNGAGKSTLLKIIAGELTADRGELYISKETRIGYLAQNSGLQTDRTIWDELMEVYAPLITVERELRLLEEAMADPATAADEKKYEDILHRYAVKSEWFRDQGGYGMEARVRGILHGMGFGGFDFAGTPIGTLSGGQKTRLALAKMLLQEPDLLMLDEPTNYLDIPTLTWLEGYLRSYRGAILVVSHDRYFLDALVDTIIEIERTEARRYTGNYSRFIERKAAEYEIQMKHYEKQQEEIARMEDFVQRNIVRASTTKRAQSRRKALERMERIDRPQGDLKRAAFSFDIDRMTGKDVLKVAGVAVSFVSGIDGEGEAGEAPSAEADRGAQGGKPLFREVSFELTRGETVALIGPNGIGKSTLLKVLVGERKPDSGTISWGSHVKLGYYDQEQRGLSENKTVLHEVWDAYPHLEELRIRTVLGSFLFSGEDVEKRIRDLSGGEKARVSLAKLMLLNANVLILDEPTNHLDLYSKEVLESALMDYEGTLLFISHDRYFLNKMSERVIELAPNGVTAYLGNYDDYLDKKAELAEMTASPEPARSGGESRSVTGGSTLASAIAGVSSGTAPAPASSGTRSDADGASQYEAEKQAKREERSRQRRIEQLEREIETLETAITELEDELASPEVYNDYVVVQEKTAQLDARKSELAAKYEEWESLMA